MEQAFRQESQEARVSGITGLKSLLPSGYSAKHVLALYAAFLREDTKRTVRTRQRELREIGRRGGGISEAFTEQVKAFARVAGEPNYRAYEDVLLSCWVYQNGSDMAQERCSEFELSLSASLEKRAFNPGEKAEEAKDLLDALHPISTVALVLGKHVSTIHRWIDAGLGGVWRKGGLAVQKQGAYYFVNTQAALEWSGKKYGSRSKKTNHKLTKSKKPV